MAKTVIWKPKASRQYRRLLLYLRDEFSEATAEKFAGKVTAKSRQMADYPESGHPTRYKTVRRVRIGKYNSFYYRVSGSKLIILFIWDGR
ncbi:MAG: type II toxin-antitoxin system RelE/ParE family toxin, partial [Saprospiraceae bacterium]